MDDLKRDPVEQNLAFADAERLAEEELKRAHGDGLDRSMGIGYELDLLKQKILR
jgi:hypothetical protein